jgi:hypothetical protein
VSSACGWARWVSFPGLVVGFDVGGGEVLPEGPTEEDLASAEFISWIFDSADVPWTTAEGIGIGATQSEFLDAYPDAVFNASEAPWAPPYYSIGEGDFKDLMLFVFDEQRRVAQISKGFRVDWCD